MLKTEQPRYGPRALRAFFVQHTLRSARQRFGWSWHYEHGQLWITHTDGAAYSVVDAQGGPAVDGFDFEQVSEGEV